MPADLAQICAQCKAETEKSKIAYLEELERLQKLLQAYNGFEPYDFKSLDAQVKQLTESVKDYEAIIIRLQAENEQLKSQPVTPTEYVAHLENIASIVGQ